MCKRGTISSFVISPKAGDLTLNQPVAASLQAKDGSSFMPAGMALSNDDRYLYVRNGGNQSISGFLIHADGSLTQITRVSGLPDAAAGIASR